MVNTKEKIAQMSFAESVEQVKNVSEEYLSRELDNGKKAFASLLYVVGSGDLQIRNNEKNDQWQSASDNGLPAAFYVSGGGRIIFEFDSTLQDQDKKTFLDMYKNYGEEQRLTSTHRLVKQDGEVKEIKTNGAGDLLTGSRNHFGLDLQIPGDNDHGHMYIGKFDDGMMIGIENVAPGEPGHEWWRFGGSNDVSAFGVEKFRKQEVKQKIAGEEAYAKSVIPGKYNCMKVKVTPELVSKLGSFQQRLENNIINAVKDLGSKLPAKNTEDFMNAKNLHQTPKMNKPKGIQEPQKPQYYGLKNIPIVKLFFKKELSKYKVDLKEYKIQNKVCTAFTSVDKNTLETQKDLDQNLQKKAQNIVAEIKETKLQDENLKASADNNKNNSQVISS